MQSEIEKLNKKLDANLQKTIAKLRHTILFQGLTSVFSSLRGGGSGKKDFCTKSKTLW